MVLFSDDRATNLLFYHINWLQQKMVSRGGVFPERQQSLNTIVVFGTYVGAI
jgi:hypothetical protein